MTYYISTRGGGSPQTFEDVLLNGLAPDGGLYVPQSWPKIDINALKDKSYIDIAEAVISPFVEGCIDNANLRRILEETYSDTVFRHADVTPLVPLKNLGNGSIWVMEQFHGPTIAFKDIALQLLGRLFEFVLKNRGERITIVGATSGDTGSAAIEGCKSSEHIDIFILHPKGRVSEVQRKQMTTVLGENVHNIALEGSFDDCQNVVKAMFNDALFREKTNLSAVNSINWARIMAQVVYYFATALQFKALNKELSFVVPTGNFGNVYAAYCAKQMGLPIDVLGISTNRNDILTRFFETGRMEISHSHATLSPSMDIQISSNFERYLFELFSRNAEKVRMTMENFKSTGKFEISSDLLLTAQSIFRAYRADDEQTIEMIKLAYDKCDYILDPHTAVGLSGALSLSENKQGPVVLLATAHPAKFPDAVEKAIGIRPPLPSHLADLFEREEKFAELPNDLSILEDFVLARSRVSSIS